MSLRFNYVRIAIRKNKVQYIGESLIIGKFANNGLKINST